MNAPVLSIGKLAQGQERYYERTVAHGQDDYYSGKGEAPGEWVGRGAELLGLEGQVSAEALSAMAAGIDPSDIDLARPLRSGRSEIKVAGYDLTFSAPKSVSVLFAVAPAGVSAELTAAHDAAVGAALGYIEDEAVKVRRGKGGVLVQPGGGFVAAAYRHRMSRALDRSCTPMWSRRTPLRVLMGGGPRWMPVMSIGTRRPPARCTKRTSVRRCVIVSGWSGGR